MNIPDSFFNLLRTECGTVCWSIAVGVAREAHIQVVDTPNSSTLVGRVKPKQSPRAFRAVLHFGDEGWDCDCSEGDPCSHVAALAIAVRNGLITERVSHGEVDSASTAGSPSSIATESRVKYHISSVGGELVVTRYLVNGSQMVPFHGSLRSYVGGVQSARLRGDHPSCINEDFILDELISSYGGKIRQERLQDYFRLLAPCGLVNFFGKEVEVSVNPIDAVVEVVGNVHQLHVRRQRGEGCTFPFPGTVLFGNSLHVYRVPALPQNLQGFASIDGVQVPQSKVGDFLATIKPEIEKYLELIMKVDDGMPEVSNAAPRISFFHRFFEGRLCVTPKIVYGEPVIAEISGDALMIFSDMVLPRRSRVAEGALARELQQVFAMKPGFEVSFTGAEAVRFIELSEQWSHEGDIDARRVARGEELAVTVRYVNDGLSVSFSFAGREVSSSQLRSLRDSGGRWLALDGGGWFEVAPEWMARVFDPLLQLVEFQCNDTLPAVHRPYAAEVLGSLELPIPQELFQYSPQRLLSPLAGSVPQLPYDLTCELRDYQKVGVQWIERMHFLGLGAILADDMGLGKTLQALCVMRGASLVIAPTSVLVAWEQQARKFRPGLSVVLFHGIDRELEIAPGGDVVVLTSYALARREVDLLSVIEWDLLVVDEAQVIKNAESLTAEAIFKYKAKRRLVLSGTPVENRLEDLWSIFSVAVPGLLPSLSTFRKLLGSESYFPTLKRTVTPFILRRLKQVVAKELPERTEIILRCRLNDDESARYGLILKLAKQKLSQEGASFSSVLEALLRLRQLCCSHLLLPQDVQLAMPGSGSKVELLVESLLTSIENGHQCLIFSQWTGMLDVIENELRRSEVGWLRLDGSTINRAKVVDEFQSEDGPPVMLVSLKAGGTGLTLTRADHVYVVDPWWNPAVEQQAADRAHRIGQERSVVVFKLVAENTLEERILQLQDKKRELASMLLDGSLDTGQVSMEELLELLG